MALNNMQLGAIGFIKRGTEDRQKLIDYALSADDDDYLYVPRVDQPRGKYTDTLNKILDYEEIPKASKTNRTRVKAILAALGGMAGAYLGNIGLNKMQNASWTKLMKPQEGASKLENLGIFAQNLSTIPINAIGKPLVALAPAALGAMGARYLGDKIMDVAQPKSVVDRINGYRKDALPMLARLDFAPIYHRMKYKQLADVLLAPSRDSEEEVAARERARREKKENSKK